jgi:hypothetical protein
VYVRQIDASDRDRFTLLSGPFRRKEDAEEEHHRMSVLPQYDGRSLGIAFVAEATKGRAPNEKSRGRR